MTPGLIKSFRASAAVAAFLIVKASGDKTIAPATAATDLLMGTGGSLGADSGDMCDIVFGGVDEVRCGGNVSFGQPLTANNVSKAVAVTAAPAAGTVVRIIGYALADGAADDIIPYRVAPGVLATPA